MHKGARTARARRGRAESRRAPSWLGAQVLGRSGLPHSCISVKAGVGVDRGMGRFLSSASRRRCLLSASFNILRLFPTPQLHGGSRSLVTLAYEEIRVSERPVNSTAFVLHGLLGSSRNWRTFSRSLASELKKISPSNEWRMVLVDLRNHGRSSGIRGLDPPHDMANSARDLANLVKSHEWEWPDVVIGHSMGGKVALDFAASCALGDYGEYAVLPKQHSKFLYAYTVYLSDDTNASIHQFRRDETTQGWNAGEIFWNGGEVLNHQRKDFNYREPIGKVGGDDEELMEMQSKTPVAVPIGCIRGTAGREFDCGGGGVVDYYGWLFGQGERTIGGGQAEPWGLGHVRQMEERWESHPRYTRETWRDHNNRYTGGGRSCWGGGDPWVKKLKMQIIEEKKSKSSISDTQASSEDKQIDKGKDVNEEGKEINSQSQADGADQEINCIKLPGALKIGKCEPEHQNHAVVFTRGEALQVINKNLDNCWEEALKMKNLLEEFNEDHGLCPPTILGLRGHIFTEKQLWVLDSVPGKVGSDESDGEVEKVLQTLSSLPSSLPSRNWLVDHMIEHGFSKSLSEWIGSNLKKSGDGLTWTFDLQAAIAMFDSYRETSYWHLLEQPPSGMEIVMVRAENSDRWTKHVLDKLFYLSTKVRKADEGMLTLHVLPKSGHWVHVDNPKGLLEIMVPNFKTKS
ncbi:hypothetical protein M5K25_006903 [Dendrobium thyrsiflorum]|uniref:AB hydrolase-1 domain-containing protein n=1 Tax=Dendrobium thyrsiflorum TaxID=117978 RepID=A0ABD0VCT4_DENTH